MVEAVLNDYLTIVAEDYEDFKRQLKLYKSSNPIVKIKNLGERKFTALFLLQFNSLEEIKNLDILMGEYETRI